MLDTVNQQPAPRPGGQDVTALVMADLEARAKGGEAKYGTRLQTKNGRKPLIDAYQEALDLACYLRQAIAEEGESR